MSLIICPECGHEISNVAADCPNCGLPSRIATSKAKEQVLVTNHSKKESFPNWIFAPIAILGVVIIFLVIVMLRNGEDNSENINVNLSAQRRNSNSREITKVENPPNQIEVSSSTTQVNPPSAPAEPNYPSQTSPPSSPTTSTQIPSSQTEVKTLPSDNGTVLIDARVSNKKGNIQTVKNEKFYLLDKKLETILNEADLTPIEGNSLSDSFGLSVLYPDRYPDFNKDALNAINKHIKYDTLTDIAGKASMKDVKPDSYYFFGITKTKAGFAIWSSPVSIIGGENKLNLQPAMLNEISTNS